ncbi:MAG: hypothetical protein DID91_2727702443 [Candidatus Nitrotoga sp. MKT]|nr:MAG: hypothetical protein DID91_2727702443 [Candidatus Nitrotoga sp. MKT]
MMREPIATTQTRQVRVVANILTKNDYLTSLFDCTNFLLHENREFAQSALFTVESHDVVSGL